MPGAAPAIRGPVVPAYATTKPMTSMPRTAAQVCTASSVPSVTSASPAGIAVRTVAARWRPDPGIRASTPSATTVNVA